MRRAVGIGEAIVQRGLEGLGYTAHAVATTHGELHLLEARGSGRLPPVVLLHGLGSRGVDYLPVLARIRPHVRAVIAPDLLGHGRSGSPDAEHEAGALAAALAEGLTTFLDEPAIVYGNSLGGLLALRFALDRPSLVRGLYLASPAGGPSTADELAAMRSLLNVATHGAALRFLDAIFHDPSPFRHVLALGVRRRFARATPQALIEELDETPAFTADELGSITAPVHLFWGRGERLFPPSHLAFFREHLPRHAVIEEAHGFGHAPHLDDAAELSRRIVAFTRSTA